MSVRPTPIILDCDPGHDDAIALLLALASPELDLLGVTTTYGNQTLEKTTANALRVLELAGRAEVPVASGAAEPLERELVVAAHVHGESGLDGPTLPQPSAQPGLDRRRGVDRGRRSRAPAPRSRSSRPDRSRTSRATSRRMGRTASGGSC